MCFAPRDRCCCGSGWDGSERAVPEFHADVVPEGKGYGAEACRYVGRHVVGFLGSSEK